MTDLLRAGTVPPAPGSSGSPPASFLRHCCYHRHPAPQWREACCTAPGKLATGRLRTVVRSPGASVPHHCAGDTGKTVPEPSVIVSSHSLPPLPRVGCSHHLVTDSAWTRPEVLQHPLEVSLDGHLPAGSHLSPILRLQNSHCSLSLPILDSLRMWIPLALGGWAKKSFYGAATQQTSPVDKHSDPSLHTLSLCPATPGFKEWPAPWGKLSVPMALQFPSWLYQGGLAEEFHLFLQISRKKRISHISSKISKTTHLEEAWKVTQGSAGT